MGVLNWTSVAFQSLGVGALAIAVLAKAPTHRTAAEVFGFFYDGTAVTDDAVGWSVRASPAYVRTSTWFDFRLPYDITHEIYDPGGNLWMFTGAIHFDR